MSFQNMPDLGYKDDGPLGAFFAGIQGGNANTASQLANAAAYEKLQQDQFNNPLESIGKIFDAKEAQGKLDDPNFLPWKRAGYTGLMMSQAAQGKKAQELSDSDIAYEKQRLANGLLSGQLDQKTYEEQMRMINELLAGGGQQPSAPIGFAMSPSSQMDTPQQGRIASQWGGEGRSVQPPQQTGQNPLFAFRDKIESNGRDFNPDGSPVVSEKGAKYKNQVMPATARNPGHGIRPASGDNPAEYNRVGDELLQVYRNKYGDDYKALAAYNMGDAAFDAVLKKHGENWRAGLPAETKKYIAKAEELAGSSSNTFTSPSYGGLGNKPTPYSDLIPKQSVLAKMAGIRTLDPKFVGDMTKLETKVDSAEDIALKRAEVQAAAARKGLKEPKYNEQLAAAFRTRARATATEQEKYEANMFIWLDQQRRFVANPSAYNPRMDMSQMGMPMMPTPVAQGRAQEPTPPGGTPQTPQGKADPLGIR